MSEEEKTFKEIGNIQDVLINNSKKDLIKSIETDLRIVEIKDINKIKSIVDIKAYNQHIDNIIIKLDLLKIKVVEEKNESVIYTDTDSFHVPFID